MNQKKLRPSPCYRQWFEYLCVADSWLILHLKGRPGSSPSGFLPEMLAFGHLLLLTVALWPYGRAEPECDEPVSATSSALLQQGTQRFYFKQLDSNAWEIRCIHALVAFFGTTTKWIMISISVRAFMIRALLQQTNLTLPVSPGHPRNRARQA